MLFLILGQILQPFYSSQPLASQNPIEMTGQLAYKVCQIVIMVVFL